MGLEHGYVITPTTNYRIQLFIHATGPKALNPSCAVPVHLRHLHLVIIGLADVLAPTIVRLPATTVLHTIQTYALAQGNTYTFPQLTDSWLDGCGTRTQADMRRQLSPAAGSLAAVRALGLFGKLQSAAGPIGFTRWSATCMFKV